MSSKLQSKNLLARNGYLMSESHLVSNCSMTFSHYEQELDNNIRTIMAKYPHLNEKKVRDLLEELDNNCPLAFQILEEEEQHCSKIVEEKRAQNKKSLNLSQQEQNRILKQSFLNLYKKLLAKTQEAEELQGKYQSERQQNKKLKELNRLLMQRQYSSPLEDSTPIC